METTFKAAGELKAGDRVIGADFMVQRITAVELVGRTMVDVTAEYEEAGSLIVCPDTSRPQRLKRLTRICVVA